METDEIESLIRQRMTEMKTRGVPRNERRIEEKRIRKDVAKVLKKWKGRKTS